MRRFVGRRWRRGSWLDQAATLVLAFGLGLILGTPSEPEPEAE